MTKNDASGMSDFVDLMLSSALPTSFVHEAQTMSFRQHPDGLQQAVEITVIDGFEVKSSKIEWRFIPKVDRDGNPLDHS